MNYNNYAQNQGFFDSAIDFQQDDFAPPYQIDQSNNQMSNINLDWLASTDESLPYQEYHYPSPPPATVTFPAQTLSSLLGKGKLSPYSQEVPNAVGSPQAQFDQGFALKHKGRPTSPVIESGQFTPVSDKSLSVDDITPPQTVPEQGHSKRLAQSQTTQLSFSSGPSSFKQSAQSPPTDQPTKRTRRTRRRAPPTAEQEREKRERLLERNRVAASKCRQKRKNYTSTLEESARDLQSRRDSLSTLANSLKDEVLFLKGQMLRHSDCGCTRVRDYLNNEASALACAKHSTLMMNPTRTRASSLCSASSVASTDSVSRSQRTDSLVSDIDHTSDFDEAMQDSVV